MSTSLPAWFIRHRWTLNLFLLGGAHSLSFAPGPLPGWSLPLVQVLCMALLAYAVFNSTHIRQVLARSLAFGVGNFAIGLYWLYTSMHVYGGLHPILAMAAVILLACFLALYGMAACALAYTLFGYRPEDAGHVRSLLLGAALFASSWTLFECLRGTLFTGFPWLNIGYAHIDGPLAGWAAITGVYGVAWLASFLSASIALFALARRIGSDSKAAVALGTAIVLGLSGLIIGAIQWTSAHGERLIVRLVQGNVSQSLKFDPAHLQQGINTYMHLANLPAKEAGGAPDVIILPETVVPLLQNRVPPALWDQWIQIARQQDATLILGVPLAASIEGHTEYTNSAIALTGDTRIEDIMSATLPMRYNKHHLVPFGEFIPPGFRWFVDRMQIPLGDFQAGSLTQTPFQIDGQYIAPNICYEDVFGEEIIPSVLGGSGHQAGATILVNLSNLAWFGDSWAVRQHLQISRMRARETGRPMLRATNTGMTAAIDPNGTVRAALTPYTLGVLDVETQGMTGLTPYTQWGNNPILLLSAMVIGLSFGRRSSRMARTQKELP